METRAGQRSERGVINPELPLLLWLPRQMDGEGSLGERYWEELR